MSFLKRIFQSAYDELWKAVIRPNRDKYNDIELGPEKFEIKEKCYKRTDFTLRNKKNYKLVCSYWEPFDEEREYPKLPCVIYLHGNSSSRCEVVPEIKYLLKKGITVFSFDFSGCGKSEGEYISLGWHEQDDVSCVVDFLRRSNKVSSIGIWGRSMGAATALMYSAKDLCIAGLVLDSPFSSLKNLINELAKDRVALPEFVVRQAIKWIKETIKEKADFNLDDVEPINYAEKCFIPAFFCHSKQDTFVNIHHCKDLYNSYAGDKSIVYVKGNHNSERSVHFKESVAQFFYKALRCQEMEQKYDFNILTNIEFHNDDNNFYKNIIDLKTKKNDYDEKNINFSITEIKIGRIFGNKNTKNNKNKTQEKIIEDEPDVIYPSDDDIFIHNINEFPIIKTNNEYINNKKLNYNSKHILFTKQKSISCQNVLSLSKLEEENNKQKRKNDKLKSKIYLSSNNIHENNPNSISNNRSSIKAIKQYNKTKNKKNKFSEYNKVSSENIFCEKKYKLSSNDYSNKFNKTVNQFDENYNKKINHVKNLKGRSLLLEKLKNKNKINNIINNKQNIKLIKTSNNSAHSPYINKYPRSVQSELNFHNLMKQIKNHKNNLKHSSQPKNISINNKIKFNQIYKRKNKENNNGKIKFNGLKNKEENKSISNNKNKKNNFVEEISFLGETNKNLIKYNKKKEENTKENNSEKTFKNNDNKLSSSHFFQENEDDFFLEEDSVKINIPHI